ncbi:MAG: hypothetical protein RBT70_09955 [Alphaproteobacteria bacterium]|jgi:hypothetical protein|nr:hypothetical protein [Alphaproteobacteria bacterium]
MNFATTTIFFVLLVGLVLPLPYLLGMVFVFSSLAAMSVIPPELLGGTSIVPDSLAVLLFLMRVFMKPEIVKEALLSLSNFRKLGLLGLFFAIAAVGAVFLPRLFAGQISVYSMRFPSLDRVMPSVTNFTQTGYLFLSVFMAAAIFALLRKKPDFLDALLKAFFAGGIAVIVTGLIDIIANAIGQADALKVFYTANYGYSAGSILEARRVLGLTPEPASFGGLAVASASLLLFLRPVYTPPMRRVWVPLVGWGCVLMGFLSVSSTAYASLFLLLGIYLFYDVDAISAEGKILRKSIRKKALSAFLLGFVFLIVLLFNSDFLSYFADLVNTLLIEKTETTSYVERSSWTAAGLDAFIESYGLGVGVGSVRTSNFFANILASTGILGAGLFGSFLLSLYLRHAPDRNSREEAMIGGIKRALLPMFAAGFLAGTTPDFGIVQGLLFGTVVALSQKKATPSAIESPAPSRGR